MKSTLQSTNHRAINRQSRLKSTLINQFGNNGGRLIHRHPSKATETRMRFIQLIPWEGVGGGGEIIAEIWQQRAPVRISIANAAVGNERRCSSIGK